jgi:hypothetical protein
MNDNFTTKETNKNICDASDCLSSATESIKLNAGKFGIITLKVCKKCSKLFNDCKENKNDSDCIGSPTKEQSD